MKIKIKTDVNTVRILRERGVGDSRDVAYLLASEVARLSDPYVPLAPGPGAHMKNAYTVTTDEKGATITYRGPYAHYQYTGEVMVGAKSGSAYAKSGEPKVGTGRELTYHGAPMRGKEWDKRMWADRGDEILDGVAHYMGGRVKK